MAYELAFVEPALEVWRKRAEPLREQLNAKLRERLENPRGPSAPLHGLRDCLRC